MKINISKKYAEKNEINKSMKLLETQIKTIQESLQKKIDGADNWLLAKKPLNNFVCASCEREIKGELDKRMDYVPWNKYPNREEKLYRYGQGFSKMIQLLYNERKKEEKEKDSLNDAGSDSEANLKLPKLKKLHIGSGKLKMNNIKSYDENDISLNRVKSYGNEFDSLVEDDKPKIMKIFKRNKNVATSSYSHRLDKIKENLITKTLPTHIKEENSNVQNDYSE